MDGLVSIVVPCYNSASLVSETLDSVLRQTYKDLEVILVNDGSSDNLEEVLKPYLDRYTNFQYISQENKGAATARNTGAKQTKGEYLLFLDSDDLIDPTYIQRCVEVLSSSPDVKLVYCKALLFDAEQGEWNFPSYSFKTLLIGNMIHISALMRKSDFDKYGPFDQNLGFYEDWDLWIDMLKDGGDVVLLEDRLFSYRKRHDNSSLTDQLNQDVEIEKRNKECIYNKYKDIYTREFGLPIDMLQRIYTQEHEIIDYKKQIRKMTDRKLLNRIRRIFKLK